MFNQILIRLVIPTDFTELPREARFRAPSSCLLTEGDYWVDLILELYFNSFLFRRFMKVASIRFNNRF